MTEYYLPCDFAKAPKCDAHIHYLVTWDALLRYASSVNMHLVSINTALDGVPVGRQLSVSVRLKKKYPQWFDFLGTFDPSGFASASFAGDAVAYVKKCLNAGAKGIKIWKNIGMTLQDKDGKYIMADHPAFAPVIAYLENKGVPLLAHLGDPRSCWLPYEKITLANELHYYNTAPQYHMYRHPDAPAYEEHLAVRDRLLEKYPRLNFVSAHLGSMEWDIDKVADRFERYPHWTTDLSACIGHIHLQTYRNRDKVRDFFLQYQDRLMYATDCFIELTGVKAKVKRYLTPGRYAENLCALVGKEWRNHWLFFATGEKVPAEKFNLPDAPQTLEGLRLPKHVTDKIFFENARRIYAL
ncbi:MAG: amidohydrolase [Bacteroidales bacterium]|jgi:predicted TIM-barrel fold metal-dependent hydrolase|nr:amidohydrolase [Bacteroidales bacterium]